MKHLSKKHLIFLVLAILFLGYSVVRPKSGLNTPSKDDTRDIFAIAEDQAGDQNKVMREPIEDDLSQSVLDPYQTPPAQENSLSSLPEKPVYKDENYQDKTKISKEPSNFWYEASDNQLLEQVGAEDQKEEDSIAPQPTKKIRPKNLVRVSQAPAPTETPTNNNPSRSNSNLVFSMQDYLDSGVGEGAKNHRLQGTRNFTEGALLKNGSKYLGVIEEPLMLLEGEPQPVEIMVVGKLSPHSVEIPFMLTGEASLNKNKTRVMIKINSCIDPRSSSKSVKCSGRIRDFEGYDGLGGVVTNPSFGAILSKVVSTIFSGMLLADLTQSVTENGVLVDKTHSNKVLQGLAEGTSALGEEISNEIRSKGTSIRIPGPSVVRVRITKDSELW